MRQIQHINAIKTAWRIFTRIIFFLREYFFPAGCALCGSSLLDIDETWYGLCTTCYTGLMKDIAWMRNSSGQDETGQIKNRCDLCGKPMVSGLGRCLSCRNGSERFFDRIVPVFSYSGKYRQLFTEYKFNKNLSLGHFFAEIIVKAYYLLNGQASDENPLVIVPVPPRPGKIKKAGWDQVEYLAQLLEAGWGETTLTKKPGYSVFRCLKRLPSQIQKQLDRTERLKNLQGRIALTRKAPQTAIILDDVFTTGSTMDVCASALKAGGCQTVYGICLVYD